MTFLRLVGALKVASLILQHMAGALHMMKMIGTSCSRQVTQNILFVMPAL